MFLQEDEDVPSVYRNLKIFCETAPRHVSTRRLLFIDMERYTTTHFSVAGQIRPGNPSPNLLTQRTLNYLMLLWWQSARYSVESVPYPQSLEHEIHYAIRTTTFGSLTGVERLSY